MKSRFLFITLLLPALAICCNTQDNDIEDDSVKYQEPVFERNPDDPLDEVLPRSTMATRSL